MARKLALDIEVEGTSGAERDLTILAHGVDDIGDQAKQSERKLSALSREMDRLAIQSRTLARDLSARPGDKGLLKEFRSTETELRNLRRVAKAIDDVGDEAKQAERKVNSLQRELRKPTAVHKGEGFGEGISARLGPLSGVPLPVLGGVAVGGLAAAGALASTAVLGAAGLGAVGAGIAAQAKDPRVVVAFTQLGALAKRELLDATRAFPDALVAGATRFEVALTRIRPQLDATFTTAAKYVGPLSEGLAGFAEHAIPGIEKAVEAAEPLIRELAKDLPRIGQSIGDFFDQVSNAGPGAAAAFGQLTDGVEKTLSVTGSTIVAMGDLIDQLDKIDRWGKEHAGTGIFEGTYDSIVRLFKAIGSKDVIPNTSWVDPTKKLLEGFGEAAGGAAAKVKKLQDQMDAMASVVAGSENAAIGWEQALDDLSASVDENGRTLDIHGQKGRDNARALEAAAQAAYQVRDANIASTHDIDGANKQYSAQIDTLYRLARSLGLSAAQTDALLKGWRDLVNSPSTVDKSVNVHWQVDPRPRLLAGQHALFREGGIDYAQQGLINLTGQARTFPERAMPTYGFAERGTGGEAFIARNAPRGRSLAIGAEAMRWHGARVVPNEAVRPVARTEVRHVVTIQYPNGQEVARVVLDDPRAAKALASGLRYAS